MIDLCWHQLYAWFGRSFWILHSRKKRMAKLVNLCCMLSQRVIYPSWKTFIIRGPINLLSILSIITQNDMQQTQLRDMVWSVCLFFVWYFLIYNKDSENILAGCTWPLGNISAGLVFVYCFAVVISYLNSHMKSGFMCVHSRCSFPRYRR